MSEAKKHSAFQETFVASIGTLLLGGGISAICIVLDMLLV